MHNLGLHHISVLSSDAQQAYHFYGHVLGLKLSIKTVNQSNTSMYHLFFGDAKGREGSEFTVFAAEGLAQNQAGTNAMTRSLFLVADEQALMYWYHRLQTHHVNKLEWVSVFGQKQLYFEDQDGQALGLCVHEHVDLAAMCPYDNGEIPLPYAILGLAGVSFRVKNRNSLCQLLVDVFDFVKMSEDEQTVCLTKSNSLWQHRIYIQEDVTSPIQRLGVGGIHHVAFSVLSQDDLDQLVDKIQEKAYRLIDSLERGFMVSSYFRETNYNLLEVATPINVQAPFHTQPTSLAKVPLYLPDFLESKRKNIEQQLKM